MASSSGVLKQYNHTEHRSHDMKPREAHDERHAGNIKVKLLLKAQFKRKYPELEEGDEVNIFKKGRKYGEHKEYVSKWTIQTYKIEKIEQDKQTHYYLQGQSKPFLRHELLLAS